MAVMTHASFSFTRGDIYAPHHILWQGWQDRKGLLTRAFALACDHSMIPVTYTTLASPLTTFIRHRCINYALLITPRSFLVFIFSIRNQSAIRLWCTLPRVDFRFHNSWVVALPDLAVRALYIYLRSIAYMFLHSSLGTSIMFMVSWPLFFH